MSKINMSKYFHSFTQEQCDLIGKYNREGIPIDWKNFNGKNSKIKPKEILTKL